MNQLMVCLVGEQPIPNLLPIRHSQATRVALVYSEFTRKVKDNVKNLAASQLAVVDWEVVPYDIVAIQNELENQLKQSGSSPSEILFNLTGGTKPMSLAAFRLAERMMAPVLYLQSEGGKSILYRYRFDGGNLKMIENSEVPEALTIDDYLKVHGFFSYQKRSIKERFEQAIYDALFPIVSEIAAGVNIGVQDIDLIIRIRNQIGLVEVKSGKAAERKSGIDQLSTISQREYLGTYAKRFLILNRQLGTNNRKVADEHKILVIELLKSQGDVLHPSDRSKLIESVKKHL